MRQAVLLGNPGTKRTEYLRQAAARAAVPVLFVDWADYEGWIDSIVDNHRGQYFLKIDPPLWKSSLLDELDDLAREYRGRLEKLGRAAKRYPIEFLNSPLSIGQLLDKRECKARLSAAGLPVTEMLQGWEGRTGCVIERPIPMTEKCLSMREKPISKAERPIATEERPIAEMEKQVSTKESLLSKMVNPLYKEAGPSASKLLEQMEEQGIYQVFIKPVNGSGAAGVSAFRWHPRTGQMALYTCALECPDTGFVNTKRLRRFSRPVEIFPLLDKLLSLDCVVERWYAKAEYQGYSYDLRAVMQEGRMDFLLARLSKGPITNLHLNNHPLEASALSLPGTVLDEVERTCRKAVDCFPGIKSAGIDILLEKGSLRPRIIEMNAQGDLIYQDIYNNNMIYGHQAEMMKLWMEKLTSAEEIKH